MNTPKRFQSGTMNEYRAYRRVVYEVFVKLSPAEVVKVFEYIKKERLLPRSVSLENADYITLVELLEKYERLGPTNLTLLYAVLDSANRPELKQIIRNYCRVESRLKDLNTRSSFKEVVVVVVAVVVFFAISLCGYHNWVWSCYRYWRCTSGSLLKSKMSFKFNTFDLQKADVQDNVEFAWEALKSKFAIDFPPHSDADMHYFLNTDRCILGDLRRVGNSLDKTRPVRGAEFFAVPESCAAVYYYWDAGWRPYESATNISCTLLGKESHLSARTAWPFNGAYSKDYD